jgi:CheY-like chemotaxis protein
MIADKLKRALVVDDDETVRLVGKRQLSKLGFEVVLAEDGLQACNLFEEEDHQFDIILMDIQMPELDGYEATKRLRQVESQKGKKRSLVVAMTASQEKERALAAGMDDFLFKPFMSDHLKSLIEKWDAA